MKIAEQKRKWYEEQMKHLIVDKQMTKSDIAKALGILPQALNNIEVGTNGLSDKFIDKFAETFGVSEPNLFQNFGHLPRQSDDAMRIIASQQETIARLASVIERLTAGK
jgi:transcriptional regulator with XRE-family HTH domain